MEAKIFFAFSGTGGSAENMQKSMDNTHFPFEEDVIQIYFNGCHDSQVGGQSWGMGYVAPDLDVVAKKIKSCFDSKGSLSLVELKKCFGSSIIIAPQDKEKELVDAESIHMAGFSRGAVTTFAVARYLDHLEKPMYIFAQEPVPGEDKYSAATNHSTFQKNQDLRECKNIQKVNVILGAYQKNIGGLHNKYFRQMAPFFPQSCVSSIYLAPKSQHNQSNNLIEDQFMKFLMANKVKKDSGLVCTSKKQKFHFIPKIIQQKFHHGVVGRTTLLPTYKTLLFEQQKFITKIHTKDTSIKVAQALVSFYENSDYENLTNLKTTILLDKTSKGIATREFIVEFENILQFVIKDDVQNPAIKQLKTKIYTLLDSWNFDTPSEIEKQIFKNNCFEYLKTLKTLKTQISFSKYQQLSELITLFLNENIIFHPDLSQYIDESDTFEQTSAQVKSPEEAKIKLHEASNSKQAAEILYHMSVKSRNSAYSKLPIKIIHHLSDFTDIARFLPPHDIKKLILRLPKEPQFENLDEFTQCIQKMFNPKQKKVIFKTYFSTIASLLTDVSSITRLFESLEESQRRLLIPLISFDKLTSKNNEELPNLLNMVHQDISKTTLPRMHLIAPSHLEGKSENKFIQNTAIHSRKDDVVPVTLPQETKKMYTQPEKNSDEIVFNQLIKSFQIQLKQIKDKATELNSNKHFKAALQAQILHNTLQEAVTKLRDKGDFETFNTDCRTAITLAQTELEKHRGWKKVLVNLALLVVGLGVLNMIAVVFNKKLTKNFLFIVKTDSSHKLEQLEQAITSIKKP